MIDLLVPEKHMTARGEQPGLFSILFCIPVPYLPYLASPPLGLRKRSGLSAHAKVSRQKTFVCRLFSELNMLN